MAVNVFVDSQIDINVNYHIYIYIYLYAYIFIYLYILFAFIPQTVLARRGSYFSSIVIALEIAKARRRPKYLSPAST